MAIFFIVFMFFMIMIVMMGAFFVSGREDDRLDADFNKFLEEKDTFGDNIWLKL